MRTFVAAGMRQEINDQDRRCEPGEYNHLERTRDAANSNVRGEACERRQTAKQPRSNKGAMTRRRQCVLLRRRVHQRVDITPYWREETHGPCHTSCRDRRAPDLAFETLGYRRLSER